MRDNSPPHNVDGDEDMIIEDGDEVYEVDDIDELEEMLNDEGAFGYNSEDGDNDDNEDAYEDDGFPVTDVEKVFVSGHQGSVFCVEFSPVDDIGASGGEDDKAFLFDSKTGNTIAIFTEHKDSVTNLAFSYNGVYLATGDMSGYIAVWKVDTHNKVWEFETDDLNWMMWHPSSNILFAGTRGGEIYMWLVPKGNTKPLCHSGVSSECGALTKDGKRLCSGFADGSVKVIDLKTCKTIHSIHCHDQQITSLSTHPDNILILSGSTDETCKLLNSNSGKILTTFSSSFNVHENSGMDSNDEEYNNSVEVASICPHNTDLAVIATLSGLISIWNISLEKGRNHIVQGCGTSSIVWHPKEPHFISCGLDGNLRVYDVRTGDLLYKLKGDNSSVLSCHINNNGSRVIFSTDKGTVTILNIANLFTTN